MNNSILFLVILVTVLVTILTYAGVSLFGDIPSIFRPFFDINYKFLSLLYRRSRCQINNKVFYDQLLPLLRSNNHDLWEVQEKDSDKVRLAKSYVKKVLERQVLFDKYFQNYAYSYEKHRQLMAELQGEDMAATSRFEIAFAIMIKAFPGEEEFIKSTAMTTPSNTPGVLYLWPAPMIPTAPAPSSSSSTRTPPSWTVSMQALAG